jgi:glutaminyl-tRNA synthetase
MNNSINAGPDSDATAEGASTTPKSGTIAVAVPPNFIRGIIQEDINKNTHNGRVHTRFPPEPNGYLHIGHAKSICLNFGLAEEFGGKCNLRFDDTNPEKEAIEYVESIQRDVKWMGFDWEDRCFYASDYFERIHDFAVKLIEGGKAYVDHLRAEQIREYRGTLTEPGRPSPYRSRSIAENLDLFARMRAGEFEDGTCVLRAKINMASPNLVMRDPTLFRIRHTHHHRTGDKWCIYPMYDFTHCLSDAIEGITHSICTLEFENNRELYDWVLDNLPVPSRPRQYEFARLNLNYTVLSKRKLIELVEKGIVSGWDDPRMPTLSGLRRRGYTPASIRNFCERIGVARRDSTVDMALLEFSIREDLNKWAPRRMGVLNPLRVVIDNYPENQEELVSVENNPEDPNAGTREVPFFRELFIEREDFMENPPKKFFRLAPGREVRLRAAYYVTCVGVEKNAATGEIETLHCTYDPKTRGGWSEDGRKVKGTLHWVSAAHAVSGEIRLYDRLFNVSNPSGEEGHFADYVNPGSLKILKECKIEPCLKDIAPGVHFQFERMGYFCSDIKDNSPNHLVLNRIVTLRDSWAKIAQK